MAYALQDLTNYHHCFSCSTTELFVRYIAVMSEYLDRCTETLQGGPPSSRHYIIGRGMETVTHVFKLLTLYTRNADLVLHHAQRAAYYYVEFIGQIGADSNTYLQLNSKDATLFVYKKTIFEISGDHRRNFASVQGTDVVLDNLDMLLRMYGSVFAAHLDRLSTAEEQGADYGHGPEVKTLCQGLMNLAIGRTERAYGHKLQCAERLVRFVTDQRPPMIPLAIAFARRLRTKRCCPDAMVPVLAADETRERLERLSPSRGATWLMGAAAARASADGR